MKEIWTLTVRTSLPDVCYDNTELKVETTCYGTFEKARDAFRARLKGFAFSENSMFDGHGKITLFDEYIKDNEDDADEDEEDLDYYLTTKELKEIQESLMFAGKETAVDIDDGEYEDCLMVLKVEDGAISIFGGEDGPINNCNPTLKTNAFSMKKKQDYYLYVDDMFGGNVGASSELYIDLKKAALE